MMHKVFAKPLFLGKKNVFMTECHSTNDELIQLVKGGEQLEGTVIHTDYQSKGKGQRGNVWTSEPGKNLLFSVLLKPFYVPIQSQFLLNIVVGLGGLKCISRLLTPDIKLSLKWPNDMYVGDQKIGGILIENMVKGSMLEHCVVGVGINLNQQAFENPLASSIKMMSGKEVDRLQFLEQLLVDIEFFLMMLKAGKRQELLKEYYKVMYKKGERFNFKDSEGSFEGVIMGIDDHGRLLVDKEGVSNIYAVKEIEFLGD